MNPAKFPINPMKEGHPDPFPEPRTIPTGWDLSEFLDQIAAGDREMPGCDPDPELDGKDGSASL